MGGTVGITTRFPDGKEYRCLGWANTLPYYLNNARLYKSDTDFVEGYHTEWKAMVKDWKENHTTGNYKYNMTDVYVNGESNLHPADYGLVVVDMVNKVILSSQDYTHPNYIHSISIRASLTGISFPHIDDSYPDYDYNVVWNHSEGGAAKQFIELYEAGHIPSMTIMKWRRVPKMDLYKTINLKDVSSETIKRHLEKLATKRYRESSGLSLEAPIDTEYIFAVNPAPYTLKLFERNGPSIEHTHFNTGTAELVPGGMRAMKKAVLDLGFKLHPNEEEIWDEWIEDDES